MGRDGFRFCAALAIWFAMFWSAETAAGQGTPGLHELDVTLLEVEGVSYRLPFGTIFAEMKQVLEDAECHDVSFELATLESPPADMPVSIGSEPDYKKVKRLAEAEGIDMVLLSSISWCPAERRDNDPTPVVGVSDTHLGCSFGGGFAVALSAPEQQLVWLHERGHVLGARHGGTDKFVMSPSTGALGPMVSTRTCEYFQKGY